ncbi:gas vesicle protein K [Shouchella patagoniensis]|uniref:gas vesicle protein K n=1 Tax=Shouchella patagoniensis TaxID=228576 RepID=UPI0009956873|nr:gas vesicle protein K [Shouchella patagoniensis]
MSVETPKSGRIHLDPEDAEHGLAQLVMTVIELLRQIVERHAIRRVEGGTLTDEQIEDVGVALMNLEVKMDELKEIFNLDAEDLNIDLGPLGNLLPRKK